MNILLFFSRFSTVTKSRHDSILSQQSDFKVVFSEFSWMLVTGTFGTDEVCQEDRKDGVTSDLIFLGLDLKIICWRLILPQVLSKFRSHFSRGLEGPISPLPHRKRQNSRKIILQVDCSARYMSQNYFFNGFCHQTSTLLIEQRMETKA